MEFFLLNIEFKEKIKEFIKQLFPNYEQKIYDKWIMHEDPSKDPPVVMPCKNWERFYYMHIETIIVYLIAEKKYVRNSWGVWHTDPKVEDVEAYINQILGDNIPGRPLYNDL